jgi:hypothetical protein
MSIGIAVSGALLKCMASILGIPVTRAQYDPTGVDCISYTRSAAFPSDPTELHGWSLLAVDADTYGPQRRAVGHLVLVHNIMNTNVFQCILAALDVR